MNNLNDTTAVSDNAGTISFTLLQSTERLSKAYTKKADGSVAKTGSTQLKTGAFCVAPFETTAGVAAALSGIGQTIDVLTYKQAIVLGTPKDGRMDGGIVTKDVFTKGVTTAVLTRTLEHFDWPDGLGLLLHDGDDINGLQAILSELYPGFADVALLTRPSASASVIDPATGEAFGRGEHAFAVIDQPRLSKACLQAWLRLAWCCGSGKSGGRLLLAKNGAVHVRGPVDVSVASPERLVYEGAVVANNLTTLPRVSAVVGGLRILRAQDLIDYADRMAPQARYLELVAAAQAKPEFRQRQAAKQAAYAKEHVDKAVARGKPRAQVEAEYTASVAAGTKKIGEWKWQALSDDHVLFKPDGDVFTIADVKRDPVKYHKLNCRDPIEGMDYQSRNCAVIYTDGAHIKIYSRAHGDENAFVATSTPLSMDQAQHRKLNQARHYKADRAQHRHRADHSAVPPQAGDNRLNRLRSSAVVAEELLRWMHEHDEDICIVADEKGHEHTWLYKAGLWRLAAKPASFLETQIETRLRERKVRWLSTAKFVTEVRKNIERSPTVRPSEIMAWDNHGKIATRSGLIDPVTLKVEPLQKQHYATWRIEIDYDPTAKCPLFLELLDDYFNDQGAEEREKQITLLQDFAGTMLIDLLPKALKRALVLLGASDTGKSTLLRTLWRILTNKPISTSFAELSGPHGLEEFVRRAPWVLDEAFNISVWHLSDRVKSVISRDTLTINPKNQPLLTKPVCAPCLWGTNHPPTFKENTEAMVNRLLIVRLTRVFDKDNPAGVAIKAKAANPAWEPDDLIHEREKAGLLNWMLAGLKRVLERGNFVNTAAGLIALNEMRLDANPVYGFIRDCVRFDPDAMMSTIDFCAAFLGWREATHGDDKTSHGPHFIGKNLAALSHPRIGQNKDVFKEQDGRRFYVGIALNDEGRAHFDAVATTSHRRPESWLKRISLASGEVRQVIPEKWLGDPEVVKLKKRLPDED